MAVDKVLVVDDNPDYCRLVELALAGDKRLRPAGAAASVSDGAAMSARCRPGVVLVDMDLWASQGGDGSLVALRHGEQRTVIVLTSAFPGHVVAGLGLPGGSAHLSKDVSPVELPEQLCILTSVVRQVATVLASQSTRLAPEALSSRTARRFVAEALEGWGCEEILDAVTLLVSELVANAVIHAGSEVDVDVALSHNSVRVSVSDRNEAAVQRRNATPGDDSGRGTEILDALASAWRIDWWPGGKTIWFEIARPAIEGRRP